MNELSDEQFVDVCYRELFGRKADEGGRIAAIAALQHGMSRFNFVVSLASSPEYYTRLTAKLIGSAELPSLRELRPTSYATVSNVGSTGHIDVFRVQNASDNDWLDLMIREHGYYERPGVWSFAVDPDKRIIAEMVKSLRPARTLELGCSTGSVMKLLNEAGIAAEGVEISHLALALAFSSIRKQIYYGDLLSLDLRSHYDVVIGMDVFEHLNPNKLHEYLQRCYDLTNDGGFLFTNIPAFGHDAVFGEVFPIYVKDWEEDARRYRRFRSLHVDGLGWPLNGHLIWATATWWQDQFERVGFSRALFIERALHQVYDGFFASAAPARKSFFVWSKRTPDTLAQSIEQSIKQIVPLSS